MKNTPLKILGETVHPGEQLSLALPVPELYSCAPLYMPIRVIHGRQQGPCVLVTAAMRGNELCGTEIVNRLMKLSALKKLKGTLIAIPAVNVYGLINHTADLPGGIDLTRSFPGSSDGHHGARMAHMLANDILPLADCCLDLRTGGINYTNLPHIYADVRDQRAKQLAQEFNSPVIAPLKVKENSWAQQAEHRNIPCLIYVAGEAMRFDDHAIKVGIRGITGLLKQLGMLPDRGLSKRKNDLQSVITEGNIWVRASTSGFSHSSLKLSQYVRRGEKLCQISDPFGTGKTETVYSPCEGVVVGKNNLPLVHEGEGLFQLAQCSQIRQAADVLGDWQEERTADLEAADQAVVV